MKLEEIAKYLFIPKCSKFIIWVSLALLLGSIEISAQKYILNCENSTLSDALIKASELYNIKFAFDAQKLGSIVINKIVTGNTPDEFIANLLLNSTLVFQWKHGRCLIYNMEPASSKSSNKCQILGSVMDGENGEQLPFANIIVLDQNNSTSSSSNGAYAIRDVSSNPARLKISYIGYQSVDTSIYWNSSVINCNIKLNRKVQMIDSVVVKGARLEMVDFRNDVDFATTINPVKLTDLPVVVETDIFKTLQLLPGISYTANSSELSIRGGSSDQNLVLFDGQTLYNLSHYYGVVSVLNPNVIKDIQVYKGGYDSRYGERISGIVDITGKTGNTKRPVIYGDANFVCGNVTTEIPIGNKITVVAAYRRSYSDIYNTSLSNKLLKNNPGTYRRDSSNMEYRTTPKFNFYDYNTKISYRINQTENISISYFGSRDNYDNSYSGKAYMLNVNTTDKNTWGNYGLSATWQKQWNETFFSSLQAGTSGYSNKYENYTAIEPLNSNNSPYLPGDTNSFNTLDKNELTDFSVSMRNICYISKQHVLSFGALVRQNHIYYHKDADKVYVYDNLNQIAWFSSAYAQDRIQVSNKFVLKPGIRFSYYGGNNNFYFEPRLAANYKFSNAYSMRFATGKYYQYISQVISQQETGYNKNFWVMADDSIHPILTANHFIFGTTFEKGKFLFDVELYYKNFSGIQEYLFISPFLKNSDFPDYFPPQKQEKSPPEGIAKSAFAANPPPGNNPQPSYYFIGSGKTYGIDIMGRFKSGNFTSWVSYSLGKSIHVFDGINSGAEMPAPTDQTHQVSYTNMLAVKKWNFSTTTLYSTGRPYVDNSINNNHIATTRTYKRLPNYSRTDFSVNYNFLLRNLRLKVGATVVNVFNTQNYFDINTRKFDFENTSFGETNLIKSQELSLNLFVHFFL